MSKKQSLVVKEIEKPNPQNFFNCVKDTKEQDCIQDEADNELYPAV